MTLTTSNVAAYCIQVAIVIAAGAAAPRIFRLRAPRPRLAYWYMLLLACLALPLIQPWQSEQVFVNSSPGPARAPHPAAASYGQPHTWSGSEIGLGALALGSLARFLWLCIGFGRLLRYRRVAQSLHPLPEEIRRTCSRLGTAADLRFSEDITSPVTFGMRKATVLLPAGFPDLPPEVRQAIVCHELLHVRRKDWLFTIAEEVIRCCLWFHPAIWWLLGRIQLTREQVVDQAVIETTNEPDRYLDALIAIAATRLRADLAPAPLFLRKRHLRERVALIAKGVDMSKRNLVLSSVAVFSALPLVIGIAAWQFPLKAMSQEIRDARGVEVKEGPWKMLHRTPISYPAQAREKQISGDVVVSVSVNDKGEVTDARIVSGPTELRKAVLVSVLHWQFATGPWQLGPGDVRPMPPSFEIAVRFDASQAAPANAQEPVRVLGHEQAANLVEKVMPEYPSEAKQAGIQGLVRLNVVIGTDGHVNNVDVVSGDPLLVPAAVEAVKQWVYKPTELNGQLVEVITQVDVNFKLDK